MFTCTYIYKYPKLEQNPSQRLMLWGIRLPIRFWDHITKCQFVADILTVTIKKIKKKAAQYTRLEHVWNLGRGQTMKGL